jgi:glyoxylase-like metal-dependent hydrolase (beta-lactamase superfamily II)
MRRFLALTVLLSVGGLTLAVNGDQGQPAQRPSKLRNIEKVRDNLYWIPGGDPEDRTTWTGGNTAVFVTDSGVVVVDTMLAGWGRAILDQIKTVTPKPVTILINSHTHNDHSGSNTEFPATVEFVAHENTKANMSKPTCPPVTNCDAFKGENAKFLPKRVFTDKLSLLSGKDRVDLYYFGRGHTNGDSWVVFPAVRAMHTGDMFARKRVPNIDVGNGGSGVQFSETLARAVAGITNVDTIITGHSALMTWSDLKEYADFHRDFLSTAREGLKSGRSVDDVARTYTIPARYKNYYADPQRVKANIQAIYEELKR